MRSRTLAALTGTIITLSACGSSNDDRADEANPAAPKTAVSHEAVEADGVPQL